MYIVLQHANHKELLTSTNNGVKTLEIAVTASRRETRCCINILYHFHTSLQREEKVYKWYNSAQECSNENRR